MKNWEHLNFEQRKIIANQLSHGAKLCEIAQLLDKDPTSISKEIKRNRVATKTHHKDNKKMCKHTLRYPYCCNHCHLKYTTCPFDQFKYEAKSAQQKANYNLVQSRIGINMTKEEFEYLDKTIKNGVDNKESIYHIVKSNTDIKISVPTVYRYINEKKLTTQRMDLPYAVTYKKRKQNKKYEYSNNKIDRSNRTFLDYLVFKREHPNLFSLQMDFLGSIKTDSNSILTLTVPDLHFVLLFSVNKPNSNKIVRIFDEIENTLGVNDFIKVFPCILTDRDPCFSDFLGIEFSRITGEQRAHLFFCDSFTSCQKGNVENMNKQLRKFFKKGSSVDRYSKEDIKAINMTILKTRVASLNGFTPLEAFTKVYGKNILDKLLNL